VRGPPLGGGGSVRTVLRQAPRGRKGARAWRGSGRADTRRDQIGDGGGGWGRAGSGGRPPVSRLAGRTVYRVSGAPGVGAGALRSDRMARRIAATGGARGPAGHPFPVCCFARIGGGGGSCSLPHPLNPARPHPLRCGAMALSTAPPPLPEGINDDDTPSGPSAFGGRRLAAGGPLGAAAEGPSSPSERSATSGTPSAGQRTS